jgi:hypothetical protein
VTDNGLVVAATLQGLKSQLARTPKSPSLAQQPAVASRLKTAPAIITYSDTKTTLRSSYGAVQAYGPIVTGFAAQQGIDFNIPPLPSFSVIEPHILPSVSTMRRSKLGILHESQQSLPIGGGSQMVTAPVMVALLLPAVQAAREAARRTQGMSNLKQIGIAVHNYQDTFKRMPDPAIRSKDGKPLLSWRVAMLPYIEGQELYQQFKLDEPWDSEHNSKLIAKMPKVYDNPSSTVGHEGKTVYLLPVGKGTMFEGDKALKFEEITDGMSNTIMVVEASDDAAVIWTKPGDLPYHPDKPLAGLEGARPGGFQAAFADASVKFIAGTIDASTLKALFTARGGEVVQPE